MLLEIRRLDRFEVTNYVTSILAHEMSRRVEPVVVLRGQVDDAVAHLIASCFSRSDQITELVNLVVFLDLFSFGIG